ncbi:response regulator [Herbaspirillum sp. GCM10030257]|uniref:response regulator n=1 Tax=Herbaspirillum sp. GCM10030257 TaxID=3273393 RepID=UPI003605EFDD
MLPTILLVEDDPHDVELTTTALDQCGIPHRLECVRDGEDAFHYLLGLGQHAQRRPGNPALILLDLKLPKLDGIEVLKQVRWFNPGLAAIPVVVLSSSSEESDRYRARALGISEYIVKPMECRGFIDALCQVLSVYMPSPRGT